MRTEALANPRLLQWARRMAGFQVDDAARKAAVKTERLEQWESGHLRPTITQLRKLADIYKRPLAVFFLEQPPPDDPIPADFRRLDREAELPLSPALRLAYRTARWRREAALELFEDLGEEPPTFDALAQLDEDPESVGSRVRSLLGLTAGAAPGDAREVFNQLRAAAERAGVLVFQAEGVEVEEMRGFSVSERPLPAIVVNIKDGYAARSFSLLHELTHVLLKRGGVCLMEEPCGPPNTDEARVEVFCNHAAGAALLPADALLAEPETRASSSHPIPDVAIEALAARYGASREAVLRRLVILGRVSPDHYERKRREYLRQYNELRRRPGRPGRPSRARLAVARAGYLFTRKVLEAYDEERITSSEVAELLGERLKHLDRIRAALEEPSEIGRPRA